MQSTIKKMLLNYLGRMNCTKYVTIFPLFLKITRCIIFYIPGSPHRCGGHCILASSVLQGLPPFASVSMFLFLTHFLFSAWQFPQDSQEAQRQSTVTKSIVNKLDYIVLNHGIILGYPLVIIYYIPYHIWDSLHIVDLIYLGLLLGCRSI